MLIVLTDNRFLSYIFLHLSQHPICCDYTDIWCSLECVTDINAVIIICAIDVCHYCYCLILSLLILSYDCHYLIIVIFLLLLLSNYCYCFIIVIVLLLLLFLLSYHRYCLISYYCYYCYYCYHLTINIFWPYFHVCLMIVFFSHYCHYLIVVIV